jgi:hypothetical protein
MPKWEVKLVFTCGSYTAMVTAETGQRAIELATIYARMAKPSGTHFGRLLEAPKATLKEENDNDNPKRDAG